MHMHWWREHLFQNARNTHCQKMHRYVYIHTYAHAYICTQTPMRIHDTTQHAKASLLRITIYTQICVHTRMHMYIHVYIIVYIQIHSCIHIYVRTNTYIHKYTYTYICTHASTSGRTVLQRLSEKPNVTKRSSALLLHARQSTTFSTSNNRTSLYPLPETPIPLNPTSPLPNVSMTVHKLRKRSFYVPKTACHSCHKRLDGWKISQASGWQEPHPSATKERTGLVQESRLHNKQRVAALLCALSGLLHASWAVRS